MILTVNLRNEIQQILDDINEIRNPSERNSIEHCYTKSGLSGTESTCKVKISELRKKSEYFVISYKNFSIY